MGSTFISGTDYKAWSAAGLDAIQAQHEMEYVNQEEDGADCLSGEWYIADDEARVIIYGTFGNYNSPGASHYTSAEVYDTEEEYREALAEWEAKPEYLPAHACCPKCGNACEEYSDQAHTHYDGEGSDYACEECKYAFNSDEAGWIAD